MYDWEGVGVGFGTGLEKGTLTWVYSVQGIR